MGNMSIAMMQMLVARNVRVHVGQMIIFYPVTVTDTHTGRPSYETFKGGPFLPAFTVDWMIDTFLPNKKDRESPLASPLHFMEVKVVSLSGPAKWAAGTRICAWDMRYTYAGAMHRRLWGRLGVGLASLRRWGSFEASEVDARVTETGGPVTINCRTSSCRAGLGC